MAGAMADLRRTKAMKGDEAPEGAEAPVSGSGSVTFFEPMAAHGLRKPF